MKVNPSIPETIPKFVDALPIPEVARPYGYNDYFCDDYSEDGSLHYPDNATPPVAAPIPSTPSFFFGETIVVNGKLWPYLEVEPRKYRFRLLNGSNNRGYDLSLDNGAKFIQIGTDLGLLRHSVELESFVMEPAERMDIIIDFSDYKGEEITLLNSAQGPVGPPHTDFIWSGSFYSNAL